MKLMKFALIAGLVLGLSGCANQALSTLNPTVTKEVEKSLTVAHVAYNGVGQLILAGVGTGQIKGSIAGKIEIIYDKAGDALKVADNLDAAGNTTDVLTQVNIANQAIADVTSLVGKK